MAATKFRYARLSAEAQFDKLAERSLPRGITALHQLEA